MSVDVTSVFIRPSTDIPWWIDTLPPSHIEYIRTNYVQTGKLSGNTEQSTDGLMLIQNFSFTSEESLQEFASDPYLSDMVAKREIYNQSNGITQLS